MNKSESKYKNTALLMNQALLILLEKKDLEFITVKEICLKAGVNRSTFYLHYENVNDLLEETAQNLNKNFISSFPTNEINQKLQNKNPEESIFIKEEFLIPYLEFVKTNKRILKTIYSKPLVFNNKQVYEKMKQNVFLPIIEKFKIPKENQAYILEFYTRGVTGIINYWLDNDCADSINHIFSIILECVGITK